MKKELISRIERFIFIAMIVSGVPLVILSVMTRTVSGKAVYNYNPILDTLWGISAISFLLSIMMPMLVMATYDYFHNRKLIANMNK